MEIIDYALGLKLAGNNPELAEELLGMLTATLANDIKHFRKLYAAQDFAQLGAAAHRLHGATAYCGTSRLKAAIALLETAAKQNNINDLPELLDNVEQESVLVLKEVK